MFGETASNDVVKKKTGNPPRFRWRSRRATRVLKSVSSAARFGVWFMPGVFFVAIGICAVVAPELVVASVSAFFVFLGGAFFLLAWKFIQFKKRLEGVAKSFEARIMIQGVPPGKVAEPEERLEPLPKKILYH